MKMMPIVESLLDTDLYKLTMLQVFFHLFPGAEGKYRFKCRNQPRIPLASLQKEVEAQIAHLCTLRFTEAELDYLGGLRFIRPEFVAFLRIFQLQQRYITVKPSADGKDELEIVAHGPLLHAMLFEIYVLAIVSETYFSALGIGAHFDEGRRRLRRKISFLKEFGTDPPLRHPYVFFDFGTRRRACRTWHEEVVSSLAQEVPEFFKGTSNVDMARRYNLVPIGTMAHEYLQAHQAFGYRLRDFQKMALENWVKEYRGDLGIALTDVVGMDAFIGDFDLYFAKLFDGLRHDSGDPFEWGEKALEHYANLRVDANTKMLTFSDGLDFPKTVALYRTFAHRARTGFGIGTHLTNDLGLEPLNLVMKLVECNGSDVAKLSDSPGKTMCENRTFLAYLRQVFALSVAA